MTRIPTGSIYRPKYRDRKTGKQRTSPTYWVKYYADGKPVRISAETEDRKEAVAFLRKKMAELATRIQNSQPERVTIGQLLDLVIGDYKAKERKSTADMKGKVENHLRPAFGTIKAIKFSTALVDEYVAARKKAGAENASVNRELAVLRRAFNLGNQHEPPLVVRVPKFRMLPEDNAREGTLDHSAYCRMKELLPPYARLALVISYHCGCRKGELLEIRTEHVDLRKSRILLPGRITKNGTPRYLPIYGDMAGEIERAMADNSPACPFLIQRDGGPVASFRKSWETAAELAGVPTALFHDLRRTALTNMIDAGMSEKEAMEISGHKTRSVFLRYQIVTEKRMAANAAKMEAFLAAKQEEADREKRKERAN